MSLKFRLLNKIMIPSYCNDYVYNQAIIGEECTLRHSPRHWRVSLLLLLFHTIWESAQTNPDQPQAGEGYKITSTVGNVTVVCH